MSNILCQQCVKCSLYYVSSVLNVQYIMSAMCEVFFILCQQCVKCSLYYVSSVLNVQYIMSAVCDVFNVIQ